MMISDVLGVAGSMAGLVVLAVMALVPALLALPLRHRAATTTDARVAVPAQRSSSPRLHVHSAA
jgi:hypothetical protein